MKVIGKFEVVEKIGEGGFGAVYKGLDPHIQRHVAIKTCTSADPEIRQRFVHEARIAGNLHHRHIVTVYDFGLHEGEPFLVQEYLGGEDLDRKIKRRDPLPFAEKLLTLIGIARGLEHAHARGVIHRDVKPGNVRVLEDGTAKIMDFGIAKLANHETGLTQTGMTLGTASYLAPEQIRGEPVGPPTDLFSFGVLAYELLTLERPFQGQHISTVLYQILHEEPPALRDRLTGCPPDLDRLVTDCLAKDPVRRPGSFGEVLDRLDRILRAVPRAIDGGTEPRMSTTGPTATLADPRPVAGDLGLDDLDLGGPDDRTPHSISATTALRRHRGHGARWIAAVIGAAALGLVLWLVPHRAGLPEEGSSPAEAEATAPRSEPAGEATSPPATARPPDPAPAAAGSVTAGTGASSDVAGAAEEVAADRPVDPPPPPPPPPGRITVPASWGAAATVSAGGRALSLDRERVLELPPGRHRLVFSVALEGYRAERTVDLQVSAGERKAVENPLPAPGSIQVQPYLRSPAGTIFVDDEPWGAGRTESRTVSPGSHRVEVVPEDGLAAVEEEVDVPAGGRVVVSYDLPGGRLLVARPEED